LLLLLLLLLLRRRRCLAGVGRRRLSAGLRRLVRH
jgi:hypothetical protein